MDDHSDESEALKEIRSDDPTPDLDLESREMLAIVQEEIERLPEVYATAFTLFVLQEMSYEEIVQVTGSPLGTVKARLFRSRMLLQDALTRRLRSRVSDGASEEHAA